MSQLSPQSLCEQLIRADTEAEVETLLRNAGYWADDAWAVFGDNDANASMVGAQQETPEAALVEKIVNSIDARMLNACHINQVDPRGPLAPQSGIEAIYEWFDHGMNTKQASRAGNIAVWSRNKRDEQADHITVAATGSTNGFASITIADSGEGQEPDHFGSTFCSLNTGNKRSIPFVQGKHTMGGTGALRFCGGRRIDAHQFQLIVSRRNPEYASDGETTLWGFTVMRRLPPQHTQKTSTYQYLAPKGQVLRFAAPDLAIFPQSPEEATRAEPYRRHARWGTLTKLYEYMKGTYITKVPESKLSFARKLELRMPEALLPAKLYECRNFRKVAKAKPTLVLTGVMGRLAGLTRPAETLEWSGNKQTIEFTVDEQQFYARVWAFKKEVNVASWRGSDGVVFALNGQTHATLRDDFFERKNVDLGVLRKSLLVVVDCSEISKLHEDALMMTSRDRLAQATFSDDLVKALADALNTNQALRDLRNERTQFAGTPDERSQRTIQEFLEECLLQNPDLGAALLDGKTISNPHRRFGHVGQPPTLQRFPTYFKLRKARDGLLRRDAHLKRDYHRFFFETDAADDYFDRHDLPGVKYLDLDTSSGASTNADGLIKLWHLSEGIAEMRLGLPKGAAVGDILNFTFTVEDDNHETPTFVNNIELTVKPQKNAGGGGSKRRPKPRPFKSDAPKIIPVSEPDWDKHSPVFDGNTAIRKVDLGDGKYELRFNADNNWLRTAIKQLKHHGHAEALTQQFGSVMAMLALAVIDTRNKPSPNGESTTHGVHTETNNELPGVNGLVDWCTAAAAPIVASMHKFTKPVQGSDDD